MKPLEHTLAYIGDNHKISWEISPADRWCPRECVGMEGTESGPLTQSDHMVEGIFHCENV